MESATSQSISFYLLFHFWFYVRQFVFRQWISEVLKMSTRTNNKYFPPCLIFLQHRPAAFPPTSSQSVVSYLQNTINFKIRWHRSLHRILATPEVPKITFSRDFPRDWYSSISIANGWVFPTRLSTYNFPIPTVEILFKLGLNPSELYRNLDSWSCQKCKWYWFSSETKLVLPPTYNLDFFH